MTTFTDGTGHTWRIHLDDMALVGVATASEVNLLRPEEIDKLSDPRVFGAAVYGACAMQVHNAGLTPEDFGAKLATCLQPATRAFMAAWFDLLARKMPENAARIRTAARNTLGDAPVRSAGGTPFRDIFDEIRKELGASTMRAEIDAEWRGTRGGLSN